MNVLDLFSGIGGFSLGLESTGGFKTVAFCEIDGFCQEVLKTRWPSVPVYDDVKKLHEWVIDDKIDVITGGFPCQDISLAGKGAGLAGARSGLWFEFHRLIAEIRPRYAIIENVSALRSRGLDAVLRSLAAIGYDAEWHCIPASAVGAPHRRDRVWIIAYPASQRTGRESGSICAANGRQVGTLRRELIIAGEKSENVANAGHSRIHEQRRSLDVEGEMPEPGGMVGHGLSSRRSQEAEALANTKGKRCGETRQHRFNQSPQRSSCGCQIVANTDEPRLERWVRAGLQERAGERAAWESGASGVSGTGREPPQWIAEPRLQRDPWVVESYMVRVANGVPRRVDRLRGLGNAIVPQIAALIGQAILNYEKFEELM